MFALPIAFAAPAVLAALVGLGVLYFLLRVTPPRPREERFPPLRLLFETRPDAAAIECYAPPPASLGQMLDAEAAKAGVVIDRDTR